MKQSNTKYTVLMTILLYSCLNNNTIITDNIIVHNITDQDLFATIYYEKGNNITRAYDAVRIQKNSSKKLNRPKKKTFLRQRSSLFSPAKYAQATAY